MHRETTRKRKVYIDDDIVGRAPWAPVLDEDVWWSVVAKLTDPERRTNHTGPSPLAWLRHLPVPVAGRPCGSTSPASTPPGRSTGAGRSAQGTCPSSVEPVDKLAEKVAIEKLPGPMPPT